MGKRIFKADVLLLTALSVVIVSLWAPRWTGPLDLRWDGSVYYVLGTSIAEGKGYRLLNEPGEIEANQYPPLLPLFTAAHQAVLGTSDPVIVGWWLKLSFFCFHASLIFATYFLLKMFVPRWLAFTGALAYLLNPQAIFHSNLLFAEIPFGLVSVLFLIFNRRGRTRVGKAVTALLAVVAFFLRSAGVALFAAWVAESLAEKRFKQAAGRLLVAAIPVLTWNAYVLHVERSQSYLAPAYLYQRAPYLNYNVSYTTNIKLEDSDTPFFRPATSAHLVQRFWRNLRPVPVDLGEAVSDSRGYWQYRLAFTRFYLPTLIQPWLFYVPLLLLGGGILGGMVLLLRRGEVFIPVYVGTAIILLCVTPYADQFRRYLTPVAPFLLVSLFTGALSAANRIKTLRSKYFRATAPLALIGALVLIADAEVNSLRSMYLWHLHDVRSTTRAGEVVDYRVFYYYDFSKSMDDGLDWLQARARPGDVVAMSMPHWAYLRNGLKAIRPPIESDPKRFQILMDSVPVSYAVIVSRTEMQSYANEEILPIFEGNPRAWKLVYQDEQRLVGIYERVGWGMERP